MRWHKIVIISLSVLLPLKAHCMGQPFAMPTHMRMSEKVQMRELAFHAAKKGHYLIVKEQLNQGVNPNRRTKKGESLLGFACQNGYIQIAQELFYQGRTLQADPDLPHKKAAPLIHAIRHGDPEIAELLLQQGADPNVCDDDGLPALSLTIKIIPQVKPEERHYFKTIIALLLRHGVDVNQRHIQQKMVAIAQKDFKARTPCMFAIEAGELPLLRTLFKNGGYLQACDRQGENLLHYVCALRRHAKSPSTTSLGMAEFLLQNGVDLNGKNIWGNTPLHAAFANKDWPLALLLLQGWNSPLLEIGEVLAEKPDNYLSLLPQRCFAIGQKYLSRQANLTIKNDQGKTIADMYKVVGTIPEAIQAFFP